MKNKFSWKQIEKNIKKRTEKERQAIMKRPLLKKWQLWSKQFSGKLHQMNWYRKPQ